MLRIVCFVLTASLCSPLFAAKHSNTPMVLTISGGVSLGAYEAGFLNYLTEFNKLNQAFRFPVVTGASAGAINGFILALSSCSGPVPDYEDSLYWKFWIPTGFSALTSKPSNLPYALFSRSAIDERIGEIEGEFLRSPRAQCDSVLGVSVTHRRPRQKQLSDELAFPKPNETFFVQIKSDKGSIAFSNQRVPSQWKSQEPQGAPKALNSLSASNDQYYLPFSGDFHHDFHLMVKLAAGSAAFPLAFEPVSIPYCEKHSPESNSCFPNEVQVGEFIDGGIYDNEPLGPAVDFVERSLIQSGKSKQDWTPILFLDPTPRSDYLKPIEEGKNHGQANLFSYLHDLANSFVHSGRKAKILRLIEDKPEVSKRLIHSTSSMLLNGSSMDAFVGFFETDFRRSDFLFGMFEARRLILEKLRTKIPNHKSLEFPENGGSKSWKQFSCIQKVLDGSALSESCRTLFQGRDRNLIVLLQVSLARMHELCRKYPEYSLSSLPVCQTAQRSQASPQLLHAQNDPEIERTPDASELREFFHWLDKYEFNFVDLGLEPRERGLALQKLNQELVRATKGLAAKQTFPDKAIIDIAAKPLFDAMTAYTPARSILYVTAGQSQEIGWSQAFTRRSGLPTGWRFLAAIRTQGFTTLFQSKPQFTLTPLVGLEFEPVRWSGPAVQYRLGLQVGRQFGTDDSIGSHSCPEGHSIASWACSGWSLSPFVALTVLDRIRLQVGPLIYPFAGDGPPLQINFQFGYQFLL